MQTENMTEQLASLKAHLLVLDQQLGDAKKPGQMISDSFRADVFATLDQLCALYLAADSAQRQELRAFVITTAAIGEQLWQDYPQYAASQLISSGDDVWLKRGLAAVSLEDLHIDYRDTLGVLAWLWRAAVVHHHIDPQPYFQFVSELSNPNEVYSGQGSTREFLSRFRDSVYFKEQVQGLLRLGRPWWAFWRKK
jgi:hypothetical protein